MIRNTFKKIIFSTLEIKAGFGVLLTLIFPVINAMWLLAIGKRIDLIQNKFNRVFNTIAIGNIILWASTLILPIWKLFAPDTFPINGQIMSYLIYVFIIWLITIGMLTFITIKHERSLTPEKYYGLIENKDYLNRFFAFVFWPFFMIEIQKTVKTYGTKN
ncbi:MAG: hypothetical protein ACI8XB_002655 [Patiriisocius sp.]|jgi:hypothetical protein